MEYAQREETPEAEEIMALASFMMHKHYCENDLEPIIDLMDDDIIWLGTADHEYAVGRAAVAGIFRQFVGQVPRCNISGEEYDVLSLAPDAWLCGGRMWIETDASTRICLRVHQRVTMVFRRAGGRLRCCHIHISNPYGEMTEEDVGFPTGMARQSRQYLLEQLEKQRRQIEGQTAQLRRMIYEDSLTGVYNRNKFHEIMSAGPPADGSRILGVACFDLNGLKGVNDRRGHTAGDDYIRRAADELRRIFGPKVCRIGGDEFVVVDSTLGEEDFRAAVRAAQAGMARQEISCSVGLSWRTGRCNAREQFEEADYRMYQEKQKFYRDEGNNRRNS